MASDIRFLEPSEVLYQEENGACFRAADAKREFFLTPADLATLPAGRFAMFGCGNSKIYRREDLESLALRKHGQEGLQKKRLARQQREANKRSREDECSRFDAMLKAGCFAAPAKQPRLSEAQDISDSSRNAAVPQVTAPSVASGIESGVSGAVFVAPKVSCTDQELSRLRTEVMRALKRTCTWDFLRSKRAPNGAVATVRLERYLLFVMRLGLVSCSELFSSSLSTHLAAHGCSNGVPSHRPVDLSNILQ